MLPPGQGPISSAPAPRGRRRPLGAWGGRAGSSGGEGGRRSPSRSRPWSPQRRRRGRPAPAGRSFPRRHFSQAEPRPGARPRSPSPSPRRGRGRRAPSPALAAGGGVSAGAGAARGRGRRYLASRAGRAAPPCRPRAAGASRWGAASGLPRRPGPATCGRPRGRGQPCPFRSGRCPIHPLRRGGGAHKGDLEALII